MDGGSVGPRLRVAASRSFWLAAVLVWACSDTVLPPLPELALADFAAPVRAQIRQRLDAAQQASSDPHAVGSLGETLYAFGQTGAAAECFRRCRALDPVAFRWAYLLGVAEADLGRDQAALDALSAAASMRPDDLGAAVRLSDQLEQAGRSSQAERLLNRVLQRFPDSPAVQYRLGRLLAARGDGRAVKHLEEAVAEEPDFREAVYALAGAYRAEGREGEADRLLQRYEHMAPTPRRHYPDPLIDGMDSIRSSSAQVALERGRALQAQGDLEGARGSYLAALEIDPKYVEAHVNLVSVFGDLGDHEQASSHYQQAVALDPSIPEAHYNFGVSLHFSGAFAAAADAFRKALAVNDRYADAHGNLATSLEELGRSAEAERHYRLAVENDPAHPMANFHLGRRLAERGRYRDAVPYLETAVAADTPGTAWHGYVLALVYRQVGQPGRAREAAQAALDRAQSLGQSEVADKIRTEFLP